MKNKYKIMIMTCIIGLITEITLLYNGIDNYLALTIVCIINFICAILESCTLKMYNWFNKKGLF